MQDKKSILAIAISLALGTASSSSLSALTNSATLDFTLGVNEPESCPVTAPNCKFSYPNTDIVGSYFAMDTNGNGIEASEKTPIGSFNGIHLGTSQSAGGSHSGGINGAESPNIDAPWTFFGGTGMHQTTSPVTATAGGAVNVSGWNVAWNGISSIPLVQTGGSITCSNLPAPTTAATPSTVLSMSTVPVSQLLLTQCIWKVTSVIPSRFQLPFGCSDQDCSVCSG